MYKIKHDDSGIVEYILRTDDNAVIPTDPDNADYQTYLKWAENGNIAPELKSEPFTLEEIAALLLRYVDQYLDNTAKTRNYDSAMSVCTYGDTGNEKFDAEGIAFKKWRSQVWERCYGLQEEVISGQRPVPTEAELIALLPVMGWPA